MAKIIERNIFINKKTGQRSLVLPKDMFKKNPKAKKIKFTIEELLE